MGFPQQFEACVKQANQALNRFIASLPFRNTPVVEIIQYGALLGGKRLRPFLVYAIGHVLGVSTNILDASAATVECIYAYSLIHDDLPTTDDDDLRRSLLTCHVGSGEADTTPAGDALRTLTFLILDDANMLEVSDHDRVLVISELASVNGIAGICGGQALDLNAEGRHVPLDALERIHRHKTDALAHAAARLGALSAGDKGRRALPVPDRYAESIGLASQVQNDILGVVGDTATLGECQSADRRLGKSTYPVLLGPKQAREKARDLIDDARQSLKQLTEQSLGTSALEALTDYIIQCNE